jgi:hypothetical protein
MRQPLFRNPRGWYLYYWRGPSPRWMICWPDGERWATENAFREDQVEEAQAWAQKLITTRDSDG